LLVLITILFVGLYEKGYIGMPGLTATTSITFSLFLTSVVFSWMIYKGNTVGQIINYLGLSRDKLTIRVVFIGIGLFFSVVLLGLVIGLVSISTNVPLPTNVQTVLAGTPLYFLIFTFLIAPINEEIFFRGFLLSKIGKYFGIAAGIILSALIFAALHFSYMSISEFAAALFFGLIAGYAFVKTKSLYTSIVGHMLVNFVTIISLISIGLLIHP
jgi:membrane protease YdiL (CAAX protease family)